MKPASFSQYKFTLIRGLLLCLLALVSGLALADNEVKWRVVQIEGKAEVGATVNVAVEAEIQTGWHLYSVVPVEEGPFATLFAGEGEEVQSPILEQGLKREFDKGFKKDVNYFVGKAKFWVPYKFTKPLAQSKLSVTFQICKDGTCLRPTNADLALDKATVSAASTAPAATDDPASSKPTNEGGTKAPATVGTSESAQVKQAKESGLLSYLWLAFAAGLTALLTPCVFPMIPITVSFFSKRKEEGSAVKQAGLYCLGIVGTFTVLGIVVAAFFGATGLNTVANNPWVNLGLAVIFIVLALSLFGVMEIGLPTKLVNRFDGTGKSGWIAPILMGLTFSLTSFTCTLPFVGAVLLSAANGDYFYPAVGMLAFSTAFSLPFFFLALFPEALSKLPRSGAWMVTVKAYMGFIELIAAVKFLSTVDLGFQLGLITREVNLALWFLLLVLAAIYLFGWIRLPKVDDGKIGWLRIAFGAVTFGLAIWVASAFNGGKIGKLEGFLPPSPYPGKTGGTAAAWKQEFLEDWEAAKAKAKETGKPIFIDFTGIYCTNCRVVEQNVFPDPEMLKLFKKVVPVTLYTDRIQNPQHKEKDAANAKLQEKLIGSTTLPSYVIVKPDGETVTSSRVFTDDPKEFAKWMSDGIQTN
jgi:thiol:disulfide interchange protein